MQEFPWLSHTQCLETTIVEITKSFGKKLKWHSKLVTFSSMYCIIFIIQWLFTTLWQKKFIRIKTEEMEREYWWCIWTSLSKDVCVDSSVQSWEQAPIKDRGITLQLSVGSLSLEQFSFVLASDFHCRNLYYCHLCSICFFLGHLAGTLQEARVRIINQSICSKLYDDLITSRMLCAGNLNGGIDACQVIWGLLRSWK